MMERWLTTGSDLWAKQFENDSANWGVGGDGVEHLLYRLTGTVGLNNAQTGGALSTPLLGFLHNVKTVENVYLMIGT